MAHEWWGDTSVHSGKSSSRKAPLYVSTPQGHRTHTNLLIFSGPFHEVILGNDDDGDGDSNDDDDVHDDDKDDDHEDDKKDRVGCKGC